MVQLNHILCDEINNLQFSLQYFGHALLSSWWKGEEHLECSQLYYIVKGKANILYNGKTLVEMTQGNWYLFPAGSTLQYRCDDFMEEIYFHFKLCDFNRIDLMRNTDGPFILPFWDDKTSYFKKLLKSHDLQDGMRLKNTLFSVILRFIDAYSITFKKSKLPSCVSHAISYIHLHLSIQTSVDEIVAESFVSKTTLEKYFNESLGVSVHEYLYNTVMVEASRMLIKTKISIQKISEQFGFCDQFYFSKRFKQKFGMTPKDYRKSAHI